VSFELHLKPLEALVFRSDLAALGTFRCPSSHPLFRDSGPCSHHTFVFPRTTTLIHHDSGEWFVGSPNTASLYNQHQPYTRTKVSDIDASDWFVLADDVLIDILRAHDRPDRPFAQTHVRVDADLYLAQRQLFENSPYMDAFEIDEAVMRIFARLMRAAHANVRRLDSVEEAKRLIAAAPERSIGFRELARRVEASPFELCRAFHRQTGFTLSRFRNSLRLRTSLDLLRGRSPLTDIALDLGFTSHSHFTSAFRNHFGITPSRYRATN
jgi:AraC-like DNA-binding protein